MNEQRPYYVSAGVKAALTEAARTARDINIGGALYRKINHGEQQGSDESGGGLTETDSHPRRTRAIAVLEERGEAVVHAKPSAVRQHGHGPVCCCWMQSCRSDECNVNAEIVRQLDGAEEHAIACERLAVKAIEDRIMAEAALATARREVEEMRARLAAVEKVLHESDSTRPRTSVDREAALVDRIRAALANPSAAQGDSDTDGGDT